MREKRFKITLVILCCVIVLLLAATIAIQIVNMKLNGKENNETDMLDKEIAFLGDSITYGIDGMSSVQPMPYPLPEAVKNILGSVKAYNLGFGGSTLSNGQGGYFPMTDRLDEIPDSVSVIGVFGGMNDYFLGLPLGSIDDADASTVYGALNDIIQRLRAEHPNAFIFLITPLGLRQEHIEQSPSTYSLTDVVEAVVRAGEKNGVAVLNVYEKSGWRQTEMLDKRSDGIHPSQHFVSSTLAPMVAEFIRANFV